MTGFPLYAALSLLAIFCFLLYCLRHPSARSAEARSPRVGEAPRTQLQGRAAP